MPVSEDICLDKSLMLTFRVEVCSSSERLCYNCKYSIKKVLQHYSDSNVRQTARYTVPGVKGCIKP